MNDKTIITIERVSNGYVIYKGVSTYSNDNPVAVSIDALGIGAYIIAQFQDEKSKKEETPVTM